MNIVVILAGGSGVRFNSNKPKQYHQLLGKEVISYTVSAVQEAQLCDTVIIAAHDPYLMQLAERYGVNCCKGGQTHNETVSNALVHINENYPTCCKVLFADSVRPLITADLIDKYFLLLDEFDSVITAQYVTDSLGKEGEQFVSRDRYYLIQKPEAFKFNILSQVFDVNSQTTAIVQQMPKDSKVNKYFDMRYNLKITYLEDLQIAEALLSKNGQEV